MFYRIPSNAIAVFIAAALTAGAYGQQNPGIVTDVGTAQVTGSGPTWISIEAPFTGDTNNNGFVTFGLGLTANGPFDSSAVTQPLVSGPAASRIAYFGNGAIQPNTTYYISVTFTDPDGITGVNPQILGPIVTPATSQYSISGVITDENGKAVAGIAVDLTGSRSDTTQTDSSGRYVFSGLSAGRRYSVTPASPSYTFTSGASEIDDLTADQGISFTAQKSSAVAAAAQPAVHADCAYTVSPLTQSIGAAGGLAQVVVVTTSRCGWEAVSATSWIAIHSGATGAGTGSIVVSVAANTSTAARTGQFDGAGHAIAITQAGATPAATCSYSVSPSSATFTSAGGTTEIAVASSSTCAWTAASDSSWITVQSGSSSKGSGTVVIAATPNANTAARDGALVVAGHTVAVSQTGVSLSVGGSNPFTNNCGANDAPGYLISVTGSLGPSVGPPSNSYSLQTDFVLENAGSSASPSLYMVIETPVSSSWTLAGNFPITHCYMAAGNYLVALPSTAPGTQTREELTVTGSNPSSLPNLLSQGGYKFISGLPSR